MTPDYILPPAEPLLTPYDRAQIERREERVNAIWLGLLAFGVVFAIALDIYGGK